MQTALAKSIQDCMKTLKRVFKSHLLVVFHNNVYKQQIHILLIEGGQNTQNTLQGINNLLK